MTITTAPWIKPLGLNYKTAAEAIRAGNITVALDGDNGAPTGFKNAMASIVSRQNVKRAVTALYGVSAITIAPYMAGTNLIVPRQYAAFGGEVVELYDAVNLVDLSYPLAALTDGTYMLKIELFGALVGASTSSQTIPTGLPGYTDSANKPTTNTLYSNGSTAAGAINAISDAPFVGGSTVQQQKFVQLQYKLTLMADGDITGTASAIDPTANYTADSTLYPWGLSATLASDGMVPESTSRAFVVTRVVKSGSTYTVSTPLAIGTTVAGRQNQAQIAQPNFLLTSRLVTAESNHLANTVRLSKLEGGILLPSFGANLAWKLCSFPATFTYGQSAVIDIYVGVDKMTCHVETNTVSVVATFGYISALVYSIQVRLEPDGTRSVYFVDTFGGHMNNKYYTIRGDSVIPNNSTVVSSGIIPTPDVTPVPVSGLTSILIANSLSSNTGVLKLKDISDTHETRLDLLEQATRFYWLRDSPSGTGDPAEYVESVFSDLGAGVPDETSQKTVGATAGGGVDYVLPGLNLVPATATRIAVFVEIFSFEYDWMSLYLGNVADVRTLRPVAFAARNAGIDFRTVFNYTTDQINAGAVTPFQPVNISGTKTFGLRWRTSGSASVVTERLGWRLKLLGYYL